MQNILQEDDEESTENEQIIGNNLQCPPKVEIGTPEMFPGGDWRNGTAVGENDGEQAERVDDNNRQHGHRDDDPSSDSSHEESSANGQPPPTNSVQAGHVHNHTKDMEGNANSSLPCHITTAEQRKGAQNKRGVQIVQPQSDKKKVILVSQTDKGKAVALGNLVTTDSTHVIGGNMLGEKCFGVAVHVVSDTGNERLPKPYANLHTLTL